MTSSSTAEQRTMLNEESTDLPNAIPESPITPPAPTGNKRRAVACKACHSLKVKCIPSDLNDKSSPCVRCIKSKKLCEIDVSQSRKKRKKQQQQQQQQQQKEDDKVVELQVKIDELTKQLRRAQEQQQMKLGPESKKDQNTEVSSVEAESQMNKAKPATESVNTSSAAAASEQTIKHSKTPPPPAKVTIQDLVNAEEMAEASRFITESAQISAELMSVPLVDVIHDGLISEAEARERFKIFQEGIMSRHYDVVIHEDFDTVRRETPILFTTVMAVASIKVRCTNDAALDQATRKINVQLEGIASRQTIYQILIVGDKTIELLKSLILLTTWYNLPELFHHRRYHIFSSIAIQLIQDLGITGRPYYVVNKSEGSVQQSTVLEEPAREEYKAMLLSVYTSSINYALFLRRKFQVSWTPYLEECASILSQSEEVGYRSVAALALLTSKLEKIHNLVDSRATENANVMAHFLSEISDLQKSSTVTFSKKMLSCFVNSIYVFLYSKSSSVEMNMKVLKFSRAAVLDYTSLEPAEMSGIPFSVTGRIIYCFTAYLKTGDLLGMEPDAQLMQKTMDLVGRCHAEYPNSTIYSKMRLLLMFYVTTFMKRRENAAAAQQQQQQQQQQEEEEEEVQQMCSYPLRRPSLSGNTPASNVFSSNSFLQNPPQFAQFSQFSTQQFDFPVPTQQYNTAPISSNINVFSNLDPANEQGYPRVDLLTNPSIIATEASEQQQPAASMFNLIGDTNNNNNNIINGVDMDDFWKFMNEGRDQDLFYI